MCGIYKTGKTTFGKALCGMEISEDYYQTEDVTEYDTIFSVCGIPYCFKFYDRNGYDFEDTKHYYDITGYCKKGKILLLFANADDEDSIDYLLGYFKCFGSEYLDVYYKIIILTHTDCVYSTSKALNRLKSFAEQTPIWEINLFDQDHVNELKLKLFEFLKRVKSEHPKLFEGCEAWKKKL